MLLSPSAFDAHTELSTSEWATEMTQEMNGSAWNPNMATDALKWFTSNADSPDSRYNLYASWVAGYPTTPGAVNATPFMKKYFGIITHQQMTWIVIGVVLLIIVVIACLVFGRKKNGRGGSEY